MDNTVEIKNLHELLQPFLGKNTTVTEYKTKRLTTAGENFGSLMLQVEIQVKETKSSKEDTFNLVAKLCPPNEWIKKVFNTAVTFKKEIAVYNIIFPTLRAFQKEQGISQVIDCFPDCYGARVTLDPKSEVVDDDAALLLENLNLSGYEVINRMKGFNYETTKLLLKDLAVFHAIPIAIKLLKPDIFNKNILPHLDTVLIFDKLSSNIIQLTTDMTVQFAKVNPECVPLIPRIEKALELCYNTMKKRPPPRQPFATINHSDYWVNNTMIKFENNKPVKNKMVDFQLITYGSPGNDIVFFLFSSVQKEVLDLHYDDLVKTYYDTFINTLRNLKCDTTPFTFELLQEEIAICAKYVQFFHIMIMLRPIFALKGVVREISELSEADMLEVHQLSDEFKRKVPETVLEFAKRGWI